MLSGWVTQHYVRFILGGTAFFSGFLMTRLLMSYMNLVIGSLLLLLAALVGMGKQASP